MTTSINPVPVEKPSLINIGSSGYGYNEFFLPNQVLAAPTDGVGSVTVTSAGSGYTTIPSVSFTPVSGGTGATATARMKVLTVSSVGTAQSGSGSYAPNEIITLAETTAATQPTLTVTHTKLSSATVTGAGTGGTPGAATLTGTTGTGTKFQVAVTISGGGAISSINSVSVAGDYTVNPTLLTAEPVTGGGLAGATLNIKMGVLTATPTTLGVISSLAANPVPQGSTTGSGTGATFNLTYGVDSVVVGAAGTGYAAPPTVVFGSGAATAIAILSSTTDTVAFIFTDPTGAAINLPTSSYIVKALADEASFCEITSKTAAGFTLVVNPLDAEGLIAGHVDLSIEYTN